MRTLTWSKTFVRAYKRAVKKQPSLKKDIEKTLSLLLDDPFHTRLSTHKLRGKLSTSWACSVGYDCRIVFDFVKNADSQEDEIFLIEIGTHDEVY